MSSRALDRPRGVIVRIHAHASCADNEIHATCTCLVDSRHKGIHVVSRRGTPDDLNAYRREFTLNDGCELILNETFCYLGTRGDHCRGLQPIRLNIHQRTICT